MKIIGAILGFLFLALALYVIAYYATVKKATRLVIGEGMVHIELPFPHEYTTGDWAEPIFIPMNSLDRRLRPGYWGEK